MNDCETAAFSDDNTISSYGALHERKECIYDYYGRRVWPPLTYYFQSEQRSSIFRNRFFPSALCAKIEQFIRSLYIQIENKNRRFLH